MRKKKNLKGESIRLEVKLLSGADLVMELVRSTPYSLLPVQLRHILVKSMVHRQKCSWISLLLERMLDFFRHESSMY